MADSRLADAVLADVSKSGEVNLADKKSRCTLQFLEIDRIPNCSHIATQEGAGVFSVVDVVGVALAFG